MRAGKWDFNPDDDFLIVDGLEDITIQRSNPSGGWENPYPARGVREVPRRTQFVVAADAVELVWHVHQPDWPFGEIIGGDRIVDYNGAGWTVTEADLAGANDQWRCKCIKEVKVSAPVPT